MDVAAKVTSKGQVTVPKDVREALGIGQGDTLVFRVEGQRALVARTPAFLDLAGARGPRPANCLIPSGIALGSLGAKRAAKRR